MEEIHPSSARLCQRKHFDIPLEASRYEIVCKVNWFFKVEAR